MMPLCNFFRFDNFPGSRFPKVSYRQKNTKLRTMTFKHVVNKDRREEQVYLERKRSESKSKEKSVVKVSLNSQDSHRISGRWSL